METKDERIIIQEVREGFRVGDAVYPSIREAILAAGGHYTFIPYYEKA